MDRHMHGDSKGKSSCVQKHCYVFLNKQFYPSYPPPINDIGDMIHINGHDF